MRKRGRLRRWGALVIGGNSGRFTGFEQRGGEQHNRLIGKVFTVMHRSRQLGHGIARPEHRARSRLDQLDRSGLGWIRIACPPHFHRACQHVVGQLTADDVGDLQARVDVDGKGGLGRNIVTHQFKRLARSRRWKTDRQRFPKDG